MLHSFSELHTVEAVDLDDFLHSLRLLSPVLQLLPYTVFFVKNTAAQYVYANETLVHRLRLNDMNALLGKTSSELFESDWGQRYTDQDKEVLAGQTIHNKLELHTYASGKLGWCITHKLPIFNQAGVVIAMMGISTDLSINDANNKAGVNEKIALIEQYIAKHYGQTIKMKDLEQVSKLPLAQIERYFKKIFQITPSQYIQKVRIEAATELLKAQLPITEISAHCGYTDHSAFTRQFKAVVGVSPSEFKKSFISS